MFYYGYITKDVAYDMTKEIVNALGGGKNAIALILETACAETALGNIKDRTKYAGMGLTQFDNKPFYSVKKASMKYREKLINKLGIDISLVHWEHLRYNPFLALLFTRLYYLNYPAYKAIPDTLDARASYWKKYYNSELGAGTKAHYLESSRRYLYND